LEPLVHGASEGTDRTARRRTGAKRLFWIHAVGGKNFLVPPIPAVTIGIGPPPEPFDFRDQNDRACISSKYFHDTFSTNTAMNCHFS
jgi:hypothetical protein